MLELCQVLFNHKNTYVLQGEDLMKVFEDYLHTPILQMEGIESISIDDPEKEISICIERAV